MMDRKALLRAKLEEARKKRVRLEQERLADSIEGFDRKYRFADEAESAAIDAFIEKLDFIAPGRVLKNTWSSTTNASTPCERPST